MIYEGEFFQGKNNGHGREYDDKYGALEYEGIHTEMENAMDLARHFQEPSQFSSLYQWNIRIIIYLK